MSQNGAVAVWEGMPVARSLDEFAAGVRRICNFKREFEFRLGQWLVENQNIHGDLIWQWADELPYTHSQLSNFMWVYRSIGDQYTPEIPWTWWQSMAAIPEAERDPIISRALAKTIDRDGIRALAQMLTNGAKNGANQAVDEPNPLVDALLLVGRLLSRESKGEDVAELLAPALDSLIAESMGKLARICRKTESEV